jgi:HD-GYP domain-containing protein (c-di-GMP phosphodiesterase class II)
MNTILVIDLKAGTRYSKPVLIDDTNILVQENVPLKQKEIDRLSRWGIEKVQTEGVPIPESSGAAGAPPAGTISFLNYLKTPIHQEITKTYAKLADKFRSIQEDVKAQRSVDVTEIDKIIDTIFSILKKNRDDFIQFIFFGSQGESDSAQNAINCTVLAGIIGISINMIQHKLIPLATGALLHDIGMLRVPDELIKKKGKLESLELQKIKAHTIHSYKIITKELKYSDEIGLTALQHHERWDGEGYPKQLSGKQISLPARIVTVADSFEAMVSERPYRNSMIGYAAMRSILSDNGRRFDPEILRVFIKSMGIYPLGSIVLLSNSCIGRVVETNTEAPLRPKIKVMISKDGALVENDQGEVIDLNVEKKLFIAKAVDPKSIAKTAAS